MFYLNVKIETLICGWTRSQLVKDKSWTFLSRLLAVSTLITLLLLCWNLHVSIFDKQMSVVNILFGFLGLSNCSFTGAQ